jgi:hypothetical protein
MVARHRPDAGAGGDPCHRSHDRFVTRMVSIARCTRRPPTWCGPIFIDHSRFVALHQATGYPVPKPMFGSGAP